MPSHPHCPSSLRLLGLLPRSRIPLASLEIGCGAPCVLGGKVEWKTAPSWGGERTPIPTEACAVIPAGQQQAAAVSMILNSTVNR